MVWGSKRLKHIVQHWPSLPPLLTPTGAKSSSGVHGTVPKPTCGAKKRNAPKAETRVAVATSVMHLWRPCGLNSTCFAWGVDIFETLFHLFRLETTHSAQQDFNCPFQIPHILCGVAHLSKALVHSFHLNSACSARLDIFKMHMFACSVQFHYILCRVARPVTSKSHMLSKWLDTFKMHSFTCSVEIPHAFCTGQDIFQMHFFNSRRCLNVVPQAQTHIYAPLPHEQMGSTG